MEESGPVDILSCAFGGVYHMLTEKKVLLLVETVIQNIIQEANA